MALTYAEARRIDAIQNKLNQQRIDELESLVRDLVNVVDEMRMAPGGDLYQEAKDRFENMRQKPRHSVRPFPNILGPEHCPLSRPRYAFR